MPSFFSKEWFQERKQKRQQKLKQAAMNKMRVAAIKQDRKSIHNACEAVLTALYSGVNLNPKDPIFTYFKSDDQMWRREMEHACKTIKPLRTQVQHGFLMGGALIAGALLGVVAGAAALPYFTAALGSATVLGIPMAELAASTVGSLVGVGAAFVGNGLVSKYMTKHIESNQYVWDRFFRYIDSGRGGKGFSFENESCILGRPNQKNTSKFGGIKDIFSKGQIFGATRNTKKSPKKVPKWLAKVFVSQHLKKEKFSGRKAA